MPLHIGRGDETRAVAAIRRVTHTPEYAVVWHDWTPAQRLRFVLGVLLDVRACCRRHEPVAAAYLARFTRAGLDPRREAVRRRALEIMAAVAILDGHPGAAPIVPSSRESR